MTTFPENTLQIDVFTTCGCEGRGYCRGIDVNLTRVRPLWTDYGRTQTLAPQAENVRYDAVGSSAGHAPCPNRSDAVVAGIDEVLARQGLRRTGEFRDAPEFCEGVQMAVVERLYGPRQWSGYFKSPDWALAGA
jgi:hypothetical protein